MNDKKRRVAYFCMEFGIEGMPFGGGLGILAGDFIKSCADLELPVVGVSLLYNYGNFHQKLSDDGLQTEYYEKFSAEKMRDVENTISVPIEDRSVAVNSKILDVKGLKSSVPIIYLYTNGNNHDRPWDENICNVLYPTSPSYERLTQEQVLGVGGARMLESFGFDVDIYHMNEGHSALLGLELIKKYGVEEAKKRIVFTTHTPVPAGIDEFSVELVQKVIGGIISQEELCDFTGSEKLNMMRLALACSSNSFGVSGLHSKVSKYWFNNFPNIRNLYSVDNGVHLPTWTSPEVKYLYDRATNEEWRINPSTLENIVNLSDNAVLSAHECSRKRLAEFIISNERVKGNSVYDSNKLTIGFARRFASYKQAALIFEEIESLEKLGDKIQIVFSGKAHPKDELGKELIRDIFNNMKLLEKNVSMWFIEDYDMDVAKIMVSGVDLWLNNPQRLLEASGTSGMKAGANFVPQLSIADGWWMPKEIPQDYNLPKGLVEGVTGWSIGRMPSEKDFLLLHDSENVRESAREIDRKKDSKDLYNKLEMIAEMFLKDKKSWAEIMKNASACNASWFNSHRMAKEYFEKAYDIKV